MKKYCMAAMVMMLMALTLCAGMATAKEKAPVAGTGFAKMDADGNGEITVVEHGAFWEGRFRDIDKNKDGKVTVDEFVETLTNTTFEKADTSKDKVLVAQEYVAYWCGPGADPAKKNAKAAPKVNEAARADTNKDGKIDKEECAVFWMSHFNNLDSDKDGKATKAEYVKYLKQRFKELDRNGDGFIAVAEYDYYWSPKEPSAKKKK